MKIDIPIEALPYILLQRTDYLKNNPVFRFLKYLGKIFFLQVFALNMQKNIFSQEIITAFSNDMEKEYQRIKDYLPKNAKTVLDIGCGVAGIDIFLNRHYKNSIHIFLLDKTHVEKKVFYNFKSKGAFYNSLEISKKLLEKNGVYPQKISIAEAADDNKIPFHQTFDMILSIISWGFHYPVRTYLDPAYNKLNPNGILIIDVRKKTGGEKEIKKKFGNCLCIYEEEKFRRILAIKK